MTLKADVFMPPAGAANGVGGAADSRRRLGAGRPHRSFAATASCSAASATRRSRASTGLRRRSKWPAQIHDVKAALRWMRANAGTLDIDPAKIAVSGNSAGGHLSLMVAGTPEPAPSSRATAATPGVGTDVAACIAFYAPALLYTPRRVLPDQLNFLFGEGYSEATARRISNARRVKAMHAANVGARSRVPAVTLELRDAWCPATMSERCPPAELPDAAIFTGSMPSRSLLARIHRSAAFTSWSCAISTAAQADTRTPHTRSRCGRAGCRNRAAAIGHPVPPQPP